MVLWENRCRSSYGHCKMICVTAEADIMGFECWIWSVYFSLCGQCAILWDKDHRTEERMHWGEQRRRVTVVIVKVVVLVEEEKENDGEFSLGLTKLKHTRRHLSYRASVRWTSSSSLLVKISLPAVQLTALLFCHLHWAFQKWIEISNPLMSPLCLWKRSPFFFFCYHLDGV